MTPSLLILLTTILSFSPPISSTLPKTPRTPSPPPLNDPPDPFPWTYPPYRILFSDYTAPKSSYNSFETMALDLGAQIRDNLRRAHGDYEAPWPERHAIALSDRFTFLLIPQVGGPDLTISIVDEVADGLFHWSHAFRRQPIPSVAIKAFRAPETEAVALGSVTVHPGPGLGGGEEVVVKPVETA